MKKKLTRDYHFSYPVSHQSPIKDISVLWEFNFFSRSNINDCNLTMDLLGSILNSMDKPPALDEKQKKINKKFQEDLQKKQAADKIKLKLFKENTEKQINDFIQDDSLEKIAMEPMDKVSRSVVHEIAEIAGLSAFSFGEEDIDRHIVIYKKEFTPCSEELNALRRGLPWDPNAVKQKEEPDKEDSPNLSRKRKNPSTAAPARYLEKYEHLLGKETAKDAARITSTNKQYGFVPSANKKDQRSIEQTLADIQAKKKKKSEQESVN